ncbi:unnamed protein product, partial [marine sediment metagenome]
RVPNFWSDGFNFFPIKELLEFFHKNGWKTVRWVGDVDCKECFHRDECRFCGTDNMEGTSTSDKYYKQEKMSLIDKILLLKVLSEAAEKGVVLNDKTLNYIVMMCQANGAPFSYHFQITKDKRIISISNKSIYDIVKNIEGGDE